MYEPGKSDRSVVPQKSPKMDYWEFHRQYVEGMEGRGLAKENEQEARSVLLPADPAKQVDRTQSRLGAGTSCSEDLHSALDRIRQVACRDKQLKFTSLWHHVYDVGRLREAYLAVKRKASAGVDGRGRAVTWSSCVTRTTSWSAFSISPTHSGSWKNCGSDSASSTWSCMPTRPVSWSSAATRRKTGSDGVKASRRPSTWGPQSRSTAIGGPFLGFTHACDKTRTGRFIVLRRTMAVRMRAKLRFIKQELRKRLHEPIAKTGQWLRAVLSGYYRYFGVPRNSEALNRFHIAVFWLWRRNLGRRSQKGRLNLARYVPLVTRWLPVPRVCQPYPEQRLAVIIQGKSPVR